MSILDVLQAAEQNDTAGLLLTAVYAEATDETLFRQMWEGDIRAFESIYARYADRLASCAAPYLRSKDLAKDIVVETFMKLLSSPPETLTGDSLAPWLFRVAKNLAIDRARHLQYEIPTANDASAEGQESLTADDPAALLAARHTAEQVRREVEKLPEELRRLIHLRFDQNLSFQEIASQEDLPLGTVLWRGHRALMLLRRALRENA
ncbi:MAG: RNA polymerase sigma factor [Victivallales bacterium]|nr:RNA polymerase sigma factor [Victivallales bacterium]